jgi:hypothetical protein
MAAAKIIFKLRLKSDDDARSALLQVLDHNRKPRILLGRHTVNTFIEEYPWYSREFVQSVVDDGVFLSVNVTDPSAPVSVDMLERWNRGEDFLFNECALVSHDNSIWFEVPCPRFGMATLAWLKDAFPGAAWVNENIPGDLDHEAFAAAPALACGAAGVILTQAARLLKRVKEVNDVMDAVGSPPILLKTLKVSGIPAFHCSMFTTNEKLTQHAEQMKAMAALGNKIHPNQKDFRRWLQILVTEDPVGVRAAVAAMPDGASYQEFVGAVPKEMVGCIVSLE